MILPVLFTLSTAQTESTQGQPKTEKRVQTGKVSPKTAHKKVLRQSPKAHSPEQIRNTLTKIGVNDRTIDKIITLSQEFSDFSQKKLILVQHEELNIREALLNGTKDVSVFEPFVKQKASIVAEIELAQIKRDLEIKSLLTSEEYDKWKKSRQVKPLAKKGAKSQKKPATEKSTNGQ
jgi:hypothetical protein